jgi:hypothetical protein
MGGKPNNVVQQAKPARGVCGVCLCTDEEGCAEGCEWTDKAHTLCSACKDLTPSEAVEKRVASLNDLLLQMGMMLAELDGMRDSLAAAHFRIEVAINVPITNP